MLGRHSPFAFSQWQLHEIHSAGTPTLLEGGQPVPQGWPSDPSSIGEGPPPGLLRPIDEDWGPMSGASSSRDITPRGGIFGATTDASYSEFSERENSETTLHSSRDAVSEGLGSEGLGAEASGAPSGEAAGGALEEEPVGSSVQQPVLQISVLTLQSPSRTCTEPTFPVRRTSLKTLRCSHSRSGGLDRSRSSDFSLAVAAAASVASVPPLVPPLRLSETSPVKMTLDPLTRESALGDILGPDGAPGLANLSATAAAETPAIADPVSVRGTGLPTPRQAFGENLPQAVSKSESKQDLKRGPGRPPAHPARPQPGTKFRGSNPTSVLNSRTGSRRLLSTAQLAASTAALLASSSGGPAGARNSFSLSGGLGESIRAALERAVLVHDASAKQLALYVPSHSM